MNDSVSEETVNRVLIDLYAQAGQIIGRRSGVKDVPESETAKLIEAAMEMVGGCMEIIENNMEPAFTDAEGVKHFDIQKVSDAADELISTTYQMATEKTEYKRLSDTERSKLDAIYELAPYAKDRILEAGVKEPEKETKRQNYHRPEYLILENCKVFNVTFNPQYDLTEQTEVVVNDAKGKKKEVSVSVQLIFSLSDTENGEIRLSRKLTAYDRSVYDGVCTVLQSNPDMLVTANQIYEAMTGQRTKSPKALEEIERSMEKMRHTTAKIDDTDQAKAWRWGIEEAKYDDDLLNFEGLEFLSGGKRVKGYHFHNIPVLYRYGKQTKQIITVDKKLLDIDISYTENSIPMIHYLIREIERIKHKSRNNRHILYSSIFEYCGITGDKKEIRRKREVVCSILENWKKKGYIPDFEEYKKGRSIAGVYILTKKEVKEKKKKKKAGKEKETE